MSRWYSYINSAKKIVENYKGAEPLSAFLKDYFRQHAKYGSKDRKYITHLCYSYYRMGSALTNLSTEEKIKTALFLCNDEAAEWQILFDENWLQAWSKKPAERIHFVKGFYPEFLLNNIFSFHNELSEGINNNEFDRSYLIQPDVFFRIRPGKHSLAVQKLNAININFKKVSENCFSVANTSKLDAVIDINKEAVIQDYSSQRIQEFLVTVKQEITKNTALKIWDCCAASGGKSILAFDTFNRIELTVSDVRPAIINNLKKRFNEAGINKYQSFVADLTKKIINIPESYFQLIIFDAPCSGSGTWGRTPEQHYFFSKKTIDDYAALQKKIAGMVVPHLESGGYFLYITCSVFKKENEAVAAYIKNNFGMAVMKQELLKGYNQKADTLFAVLFKKA